MAEAIRKLPLSRRRVLAAALEDDRLADLLEELSEDEQVRIMEDLDLDKAARVLDEMEADDAADLLGEFSAPRRAELLGAMDPDEAEPVRRLLTYEPDTAGGLMTPEPVVLGPQATVAEALARIRDHDLPVPLATQVFVCLPPHRDADRPLPRRRELPAPAARGAVEAAVALPRRGARRRSPPTPATARSPSAWPPTT